MFNIRNFISDSSFQISYVNNSIDIINYTSIVVMDSNKIIVSTGSNKLLIEGNDLVVKKLLESEMVVSGKIMAIKFLYE